MSGWVQDGGPGQVASGAPGPVASGSPGPIVGWEVPSTLPGLSVRETIGSAWRIYRRNAPVFVALAAIPAIAVALTLVPSMVIFTRTIKTMVAIVQHLDAVALRTDPQGYDLFIQQQIQAAARPESELLVLSGVASGLAVLVGVIGAALLTAAALDGIDGRRPSVRDAFRALDAHGRTLMLPALILGVASILLTIAPIALTPSFDSPAFDSPSLARATALSSLLGLAGFLVAIVVVVFAVRWAVAIPAILAEDLGLRAGLSRSAALTHGIRLRITLAFLVYGVVYGFVGFSIAAIVAVVTGFATRSVEGGVAAYLVVGLLVGMVFGPLGTAMAAHIYRLRAPLQAEAPATEPDASLGLHPGD